MNFSSGKREILPAGKSHEYLFSKPIYEWKSEIMKYLTPLFHLTENHNNSINTTNTMISHSMNVGDDTNLRSTRMRMTSQLHDRIHVTSKGERGVKKGLHLNHQESCTCCFPATEEEVLSPWQRNMTWFLPSSSKYDTVIMSFDHKSNEKRAQKFKTVYKTSSWWHTKVKAEKSMKLTSARNLAK